LFSPSFDAGVYKSFDFEACFGKFSIQGFCLTRNITEVEKMVLVRGFPSVLDVLEGIFHLLWVQEEVSELRSSCDDREGVVVRNGVARVERRGGDGRHFIG
jgi:hypothetical protein